MIPVVLAAAKPLSTAGGGNRNPRNQETRSEIRRDSRINRIYPALRLQIL
jgi:hypothetical protein